MDKIELKDILSAYMDIDDYLVPSNIFWAMKYLEICMKTNSPVTRFEMKSIFHDCVAECFGNKPEFAKLADLCKKYAETQCIN